VSLRDIVVAKDAARTAEAAALVRAALADTAAYVERCQFRGYDPYDALLSPLFRLPLLRSNHFVRLAAQQLVRRLTVNVRPLLGIGPHASAVTFARMLEGYAYLTASAASGERYDAEIELCLRRLHELRTPGYSGDCWGYEFDWEARYGVIPAGTPNIVATGIVTNALFETYRLLGERSVADSCVSAARFALHDLSRTPGADGSFCWSYSPRDRQVVLNASMHAARLCAQAVSLGGDETARQAAADAVRFVVGHQRPDGAWPYAVGDTRTWVDNFHTGYVLECLEDYERDARDDSFAEAKARGWRFYRTHFLTEANVPKYFDTRVHPIDATACAQTIGTLCTFGDVAAALSAARWMLAHMRRSDGAFVYRRHRLVTNRIPYLRWSVAPMFAALSRLAYAVESA